MDFEDGIELCFCAIDKYGEERAYLRWIVGSQYEMSFDDFKKRIGYDEIKNQKIEKPKTAESILEDVKKILG